MMSEPSKRAIMRLDNYDYTQARPYFLTICLHENQHLFGDITKQGEMKLSPAGRMVQQVWADMPRYNPGLVLDEFIVMPDHFHAIIGFLDREIWRARWPATTDAEIDQSPESTPKRMHVSDIVRRFKNQTMKRYRVGVQESGWPTYNRRFWQRGYWDRIIRDDRDLQAHREYIYNNVAKKHLERLQHDRSDQQ